MIIVKCNSLWELEQVFWRNWIWTYLL